MEWEVEISSRQKRKEERIYIVQKENRLKKGDR